MGVDVYAMSGIGLSFNPGKFAKTVKFKKFDHNYDENVLFCPKTGKQCWEQETKFLKTPVIDRPDLVIKSEDDVEINKIGNYKVINSEELSVVCVVSCKTKSNRIDSSSVLAKIPIDFNKEVENFKKDMKDLGIWDQKNFGLHVILYESY